VSRTPDPIDVHVAARLRMRRMMLGVSQEALAARIGVTFQQIQKYEKGQNRVGASRLFQLADALTVGIDYFFEGLPGAGGRNGADPLDASIMALLGTTEGMQLHLAFSRVSSQALRRRVVELVAAMADEFPAEPA
jgi:transcriptional regulator with XRE-family HTH domain